MNTPRFRHLVALSLVCIAPPIVNAAPLVQPSPSHTAPAGALVFGRSLLDANGLPRSTSLFLTTPGGSVVQALTPRVDGRLDGSANWSPHATHVVFQRGSLDADPDDRYDVYTVDRTGGQLHQLSAGRGNFVTPAWGPGNRIAYVSKYGDHDCLSIVDGNGHHRRDLFCAPSPASIARPTWSADGASVYIATGYLLGEIDPFWRSLAYRVDATTGAATLLTDQVMDEPQVLDIAPDGSRGIYSDAHAPRSMTLVDFTSGAATELGWGYAARWSGDGRRIAFTGEVFEGAPEFRYYEPLYVMDADGSHLRRITTSRLANHAYTGTAWAKDGVHLLVNRRTYLDPSLTISSMALRIVDVDTRTVSAVTGGAAEPGAWFER